MKRPFACKSLTAGAVVCAAVFCSPLGQALAAGSQLLSGHVPVVASRLQPLRHFDGTNHLKLVISLPLRDREGLTNLLQQVYDPTSPNYHHYLTAAQFAGRFGPAASDYATLRAFAISNHLAITGSHPNRTLLDVEGSVSDIEKALHTSIQVYQHPTENREFYAPSNEPSVDLSLPLLHVTGLDNYMKPHPLLQKRPAIMPEAGSIPASGSGPNGNYLGYDFRNAYIPGVALTGTGQSVALVEFDAGYYQSDITAYEALAGLPNVPVSSILLDGYDGGAGSDNGEVSLDIEMAIDMAPGLSSILVYEGEIGDDILNRIATDNLSRQISASWAGYADAASDQIFLQMALQGQSFFNACGDGDAWVGTIYPPCDDPNITVVGGTTLSTSGPNGSWTSEKVWNWGYNPPGWIPGDQYVGGSGGISTVWAIPSWQTGINMTQNLGSTTMRNVPDVALTADQIWVLYENGQAGSFGGTSCASPLWAAYTALVNQQAAANGEPTQGFINPAIYAIGKSGAYGSDFRDTVLGNNTWTNSPNMFYAVPGFDLCTGWGTPNPNLINALAPLAVTPVLTVVTNIISGGNGNGVIDYDECNDLTIVLTNQASILATGVQATLYSTTPGAIVAQGTAAYPDLLGHGSGNNLTPFTLSTEPSFVCGTPINLTLVVKCDQTVETNYLILTSGVVGSPDSFTNSTPVMIPFSGSPVSSPVVVYGLQAVGKLTVSVFLSCLYDAGVTLQLTSPSGTNVILSQNNGGFASDYGVGCIPGSQTVFDDAATTPILEGSAPYVGSFSPQEPLSVFKLVNGTNLNGVWNLQVVNEFPGDTTVLECWSLNISPEVCLDGGGECPGADLSLAMAVSPNTTFVDSNVVYTLTISNAGPSTAQGVLITQTLPGGAYFVGTSNYPVTASVSGSNLNLNLGSLPVYGTATVAVITTNLVPGLLTSSAVVGSDQPDPNLNNNSASVSVLVTQPIADLAVTIGATPTSVLQGEVLTYTVNVTNNGPFTAVSVTNVTTLPPDVTIVGKPTVNQQGIVAVYGSNEVFTTWSNLGPGSNAVVTVSVIPTFTGNITANSQVFLGPADFDPNTFNNTASVTTTVGPAADVSVSAYTLPNLVVAGSNLDYIITVSNAGPSAATGVTLIQTVPSGCTFLSNNIPGSTTVSNGSPTVSVSSNMAAGTSILVTNVFKTPTLLQGVKSNLLTSTMTVFSQPGDSNPSNNIVTLQTFEEPPTITVVPDGAVVIAGSANGAIGTNGTYTISLSLQNVGNIPTTGLVATMQSGPGVTPVNGSNSWPYGVLAPAAAAAGQYEFTATGTNGGSISLVLALTNNSTNLGTATFTFQMPVAQSFSNTAAIYVPIPTNILESGPASLYPSQISVSNVTGTISSVTVTISNFLHAYPNDVGLLLVGPTNGLDCVLMSAVADYTGMSAPVTLTFDQNAPAQLPYQFEGIYSGSWQPTDFYPLEYGVIEAYTNCAPAPMGPYNTNLNVFTGSIPANGTWSLYAYDFVNGDTGIISNGWSLNFTTVSPVNPTADLAISTTSLNNPVAVGNNITNIWAVTNYGPNITTNGIYLTNLLPVGLTFVTNVLPAGVSNLLTGSTTVCALPNLIPGNGLVITNVVMVNSSAIVPQTNLVFVSSTLLDENLINNTNSTVTTIIQPPADIAVLPISAVPSPVVVNSNVVFTLTVTNNGPSNALNVVGLFTLSGLQVVSSNIGPEGVCYTGGGVEYCEFGTIPSGGIGQVILSNLAPTLGMVTNTWIVSTSSTDTNLANNSTTNVLVVTNQTADIVPGSAILLSQLSAPYNGALNSGQTNVLSLVLSNIGSGPTTNLVATLVSNKTLRPITAGPVTYGRIANGSSTANTFTVVASGTSGAAVTAELSLTDGSNTNIPPVYFNFVIPMTQGFTNLGAITIPSFGEAGPYPAEILVSGLVNGATNLLLSKATATLYGFGHSFPHDVEVALVNPTGQEVMLMEHTGGPYSVSNLTITFDDAASQQLPATQLSSGTFLATEYPLFDVLPDLSPIPTNSTNLAYLNGQNPNGIWSLYVYDDTQGNDGLIAEGWSLNLTAVSPVNPASRLVVTSSESPNPVYAGNFVAYQITVSNAGPNTASSVMLTNTTTYGGTVTSNLGALALGGSTNVTLQVQIGSSAHGTITNTATATAAYNADLYLADSTSILTNLVESDPIALAQAGMSNGLVHFTVNGYIGQTYIIQAATNLTTKIWTNIYTNTGLFTFTNSNSSGKQEFFRVLHQPQ